MKVRKDKTGFYARTGDFFGPTRPTAQAAISALDQELEAYHPLNHIYVRGVDGTVLHIFQIVSHDWTINLIPPNGYVGKGIGAHGTFGQAKETAIAYARANCGGVIETPMVGPESAGVGRIGGVHWYQGNAPSQEEGRLEGGGLGSYQESHEDDGGHQ